MRELRTTASVLASGTTRREIAWAITQGRWTSVITGVLGRGPKPPSQLDIARATALVSDGIAEDTFAGVLHNFDGVRLGTPRILVPRSSSARRAGLVKTTTLPSKTVLRGQVRCTTLDDTLLRLAESQNDTVWEQAAEHCLHKKYVSAEQLGSWAEGRTPAARRVRRFIEVRGGLEIPPTESLLETLAVQLIRSDPDLPAPTRQFRVFDPITGRIEARVDLCWPELALFLELDGQQHKGQPVYDAVRQNKVTAIMRWRCVRFTWDQVNHHPRATLAEIRQLLMEGCSIS